MATDTKNHNEDSKNRSAKNGLINLNTATLEELEAAKIPNIAGQRLKALVAERDHNGAFTSIDDIHRRVASIGDRFTHGLENFVSL